MSGIAHLPLLLARKIVRSFFDQKKSRHIFLAAASLILSTLTCLATAAPSSPIPPPDLRVIYKALGLKVSNGKFINACDEIVQPEIEAIDLNADGKSEVFVTMTGSCYGAAGAELSLFILDRKGQWHLNLGFPAGSHKLLGTNHMGYPDIEIGGPGFCFPVWRWNGSQYAIHKRCDH